MTIEKEQSFIYNLFNAIYWEEVYKIKETICFFYTVVGEVGYNLDILDSHGKNLYKNILWIV